MRTNFSLNINLLEDEPECYEYKVTFLDRNGVRRSEEGTCPSMDMCYDSAVNYYNEVMHGYIEEDSEDGEIFNEEDYYDNEDIHFANSDTQDWN